MSRSTMKLTRTVALLLSAASLVTMIAVPPALAATACERPDAPVVEYAGDQVIFRFRVDLSGCAWWEAKTLRLNAEWTFESLLVEGSGKADSVCAGFTTDGLARRVAKCALRFPFNNSRPIQINERYEGTVTYPWKNGRGSIDFAFVCSSVPTKGCSAG